MANRLAAETSPYLLQHAANPVDWYPWGEEALLAAREQDKPIFLSIGYAACHWCHVMEHESFEDAKTAEILNHEFISIKVDREERPDLDHLYMHGVMLLRGGHGGWPLSAFLTPEQELFFGGTYWPPEPRHGLPSFTHVLRQVAHAYRAQRSEIAAHARTVSDHLRSALEVSGEVENPDASLLVGFTRLQERQFDSHHGGFGTAPKFPHPLNLSLIMRLWSRWDDSLTPSPDRLRAMVEKTLTGMAHGGIFDHLGGGFARYSVDSQWLVPHFEKMLYDNALLASCYLDSYQLWGVELFSTIARRTLDYLQRDMRDEAGGFHSSEDADSEGEEGKFYVWSREEIVNRLGNDGPLFCDLYGVTAEGNFEGHNILHLPVSMETFAQHRGLNTDTVRMTARAARHSLFEIRQKRVRPGRDDKVLTNWNALAIEAFAKAAIVLDNKEYLNVATNTAEFLCQTMCDPESHLLHTYRRGAAKQPAFLDDYSLLINALITLYQASWDSGWLTRARDLTHVMIESFGDPQVGGFYYTTVESQTPIARWKEVHDSSIPSGNATAALALWRLGHLTGNPDWLETARQTVRHSMSVVKLAPTAASQMLTAAESMLDRRWLVVVLVPELESGFRSAIRAVQRRWSPHIEYVVHVDTGTVPEVLSATLGGKSAVDGQVTAYFCQDFACQSPVSGWSAIDAELGRLIQSRHPIR